MLEEQIYQDYVTALKAKDKAKSTFLSFLRSGLKNKAIDLKKEKLDDDEVLTVLKKEQKRLQDAKESVAKSSRQDLLTDLESELTLLNQYLPKAIAEDELITIIEQSIAEEKAVSIKDMGKVMKSVLGKVGVQADSKTVSQIVKSKLSSL
tara:strand:- start:78 stop:527 length:450 start_codon:yes stop_codon:yes gene_type:complete